MPGVQQHDKGKEIHGNKENTPQRITTQYTEKKIMPSARDFVRSYDILDSQEVAVVMSPLWYDL